MTFEEWGAMLRGEREKRHLSIDDVANELKINPRQIRALEDGDVASLPHPAYVRGFIRSYASWLGMSQQEIHEGLENATNAQPQKPAKAPARPDHQDDLLLPEPEAPREKRGGHKGLLTFAILCAIAGGIYYAWQTGAFNNLAERYLPAGMLESKVQNADTYMAAKDKEDALKAEQQKKDREQEARESAEQSAAEKSLPLPGNNNETVIAPIPGADTPAEQATASIEAAKSSPAPAPSPAPADTAQTTQAAQPADASATADQTPGQHKLIITATEECWVHSNADKTDTRQFSLRKGDTFALAFSKSLELKLGNAGGVTLRYDGVDLPAPGTSGQVRTIKFPPPENQ